MTIKIEGYGYEYDALFYGGPFDGLADSVVSLHQKEPPEFPYRLIEGEDLSEQKPLGMKILDCFKEKHIPDDERVAVYRIEGNPDEYGEDDVVPYHYKETMNFGEYREKYQ